MFAYYLMSLVMVIYFLYSFYFVFLHFKATCDYDFDVESY